MLDWLIAAKAPSAIEAIAMKTMICCHWATSAPSGDIITRVNSPSAAILGATAKKAVIGVGAPS